MARAPARSVCGGRRFGFRVGSTHVQRIVPSGQVVSRLPPSKTSTLVGFRAIVPETPNHHMRFGFGNLAPVRQACTRQGHPEVSAESPDAERPGLFVAQRPAERCRELGVTHSLETC